MLYHYTIGISNSLDSLELSNLFSTMQVRTRNTTPWPMILFHNFWICVDRLPFRSQILWAHLESVCNSRFTTLLISLYDCFSLLSKFWILSVESYTLYFFYLTFTDCYMYTTANSVWLIFRLKWCLIPFINKYQSQYYYLS